MPFFSCNKVEDSLQTEIVKNKTSKNSTARKTGSTDSTEYYLDLLNSENPNRDIIKFIKNGGYLPSSKAIRTGDRIPTVEEQSQIAAIGNPTYPNYHCCNNICLTIPEDPYGFYLPFTDVWGNSISFIGRYGTDPRQMYYVYLPTYVNPNSKIVVMIHGGGWISGPDPDQVNGWGSAYAPDVANSTTNKQANNIVKKLIQQGYVVVSLLYRLVSYGNSNTDILSTPITIPDQINDIDAAITHIKTNFPTCLWQTPLNANNIQLMGESAGAQLALLYTYTRSNTSYIKSVVSVAAPSNMNAFANLLMTKPYTHTCSTALVVDNYNNTTFTHFPFYSIVDPLTDYTNGVITNVTNYSSISCSITTLNSPWWFVLPLTVPSTARRSDTYFQIESCVRQIITNPSTNAMFTSISPRHKLNAARSIPTFIIHGTKDGIVPYNPPFGIPGAADGMSSALTTFGGLIGTYSNGTFAPTTYSSSPKHLIKLYTNANHNVSDFQHPGYSTNTGPSETQVDIVNWLNGH